jgi:hypothetical protein
VPGGAVITGIGEEEGSADGVSVPWHKGGVFPTVEEANGGKQLLSPEVRAPESIDTESGVALVKTRFMTSRRC